MVTFGKSWNIEVTEFSEWNCSAKDVYMDPDFRRIVGFRIYQFGSFNTQRKKPIMRTIEITVVYGVSLVLNHS